MNPKDYLEWSQVSGLYSPEISHVEQYETLAKKVSPEGLTTIVVGELLESDRSELDIARWRKFFVYELGDELERRISLTATALEAIEATRAAAAVRESKSHSPYQGLPGFDPNDPDAFLRKVQGMKSAELMCLLRTNIPQHFRCMGVSNNFDPVSLTPKEPRGEYETFFEIERLLNSFVKKYRGMLEADIERLGDPQDNARFTPPPRRAEIEQERYLAYLRNEQAEDFERLMKLRAKIEKLEAAAAKEVPKPVRRVKEVSREFRRLLRKNSLLGGNGRAPEMYEFAVYKADDFIAKHPKTFAAPLLSDAITARLSAIGTYAWTVANHCVSINWEEPPGFKIPWATVSLEMFFPVEETHCVKEMLDVAERTQRRLPKLIEAWEVELVDWFRTRSEKWLDDSELESFERGQDGKITDGSILAQVSSADIKVARGDDDPSIGTHTDFYAEWEEGGMMEVDWNDDPDEADAPAVARHVMRSYRETE